MKSTNMGLKEVVTCPCGCGKQGTPRVRAWRNGQTHTKNCDKTRCKQCRGSSEAKTSAVRERKMSRELGARRVTGSGRGHGADMVIEGQLYIETTKLSSVMTTMHNLWTGPLGVRAEDRAKYHAIADSPYCLHAGDLVLVPFHSLVLIASTDFCELTSYTAGEELAKPVASIEQWYSGKAVTTKLDQLRLRCKHAQLPGALLLEWQTNDRGAYYGQLAVFTSGEWAEFMEYNDHRSWDAAW